MKIAVFQFAPEFGNKEGNLRKIHDAVAQIDADLLVLPELCTTGYQFVSEGEVSELSESIPDGPTVAYFQRLCREEDCHLVAGLAERDDDRLYNSSVLVGPGGFIGVYRKVHLFCDEKRLFCPGNLGFPVWDAGGAKIGMMICFDWVFPEAARSLALQGAELICHPANLVLPYCQDAMVTRSIENGVYTVTVNRIGSESRRPKETLTFTGRSQVVGPRGGVLLRTTGDREVIDAVEIRPEDTRNKWITPTNHLFDDRMVDQYESV